MIRAHFGLAQNPFASDNIALLSHQQEVFDILMVHCQHGGMCLVLGEPGVGKSVIKKAIETYDDKQLIAPVITRTLHTHRNTLRILCQAFGLEMPHDTLACEKQLIEEAFRQNRLQKMIVPIIDDAHLMPIEGLRKLRLLFEDFPKNHNLILIGQPSLMQTIHLTVNEDIKSRVTYSTILRRIAPEEMSNFILDQLDRVGLGHNSFTEEALALIVRSGQGVLRKTRNLCIGALIETVRDHKRVVDLEQVNRVLIQPHWRNEFDLGEAFGVAPEQKEIRP